MGAEQIRSRIYYVGVRDWEARLFDQLIPLPDGTSYNSYLIQGSDRTALIDAVDPKGASQLLANLQQLNLERLDYLVVNHAEQDHSGSISAVLSRYPEATVVCNKQCRKFLLSLHDISPERIDTIKHKDTLSLGDLTLQFLFNQWVHWPETMSTYLLEERILFSCDLFGSHLAVSELFYPDECRLLEAAKRYYAEIMMPFRGYIKKHLRSFSEISIDLIAPSHGPLYAQPSLIVDAYGEWISDKVSNAVLIPYVSMHGSVQAMVEYLTEALIRRGLKVVPFNIVEGDIGQLAIEAVDAASLVVGTSVMLYRPHPHAAFAAQLLNALKPKTRFAAVIGSYGWSSGALHDVKEMLSQLSVEFLSEVFSEGHPTQATLEQLDQLAETLWQRHRAVGLCE